MSTLYNKKGFTLIEILIALVTFSVGMLGVAGLVIVILHSNTFSKNVTAATTFAHDKMEEINRLDFASVATAVGTEVWDPENQLWSPANPTDAYTSYKRVTNVDTVTLPADMTIVTVTILWDSDTHTVSLQTILTQ
jgi:prepilin-type N-terminal cleavage/methylation domain-containing protein